MNFYKTLKIFVCISTCIFSFQINAQEKYDKIDLKDFPIPIGLDAYKMWDKLPQQRIGVRTYMRSTYDRTGGNEFADASHYLFANEENYNVALDVKGKGVFYFFRANHWHGSPWHFVVDNKDFLVKETGTKDPLHALKRFKKTNFIPAEIFPEPLNWTWGTTNGADLIWTPMPFEKEFSIAYSKTHYGTGYFIYKLYANEENLSQKISSWKMKKPSADILKLISQSGTDIAPQNIKMKKGSAKIGKKSRNKIMLVKINEKASTVRALKLKIPLNKAIQLERVHLRITWDDAKHPSIDAPLCLFFGAGTLFNRKNREYLIKGFPINIRYDYKNKKVELACYYPMPFFKSAKFELTKINNLEAKIDYEIKYEDSNIPREMSSYFHATFKDFLKPELGNDLRLLDTKGTEGHKDWSGNFVGTSFIFSHANNLSTLEGDPRFFFDDSKSPKLMVREQRSGPVVAIIGEEKT